MRIAVGCDHRAEGLKQLVMRLLKAFGHECQDFGCQSEESADYPDIAAAVGEAVTSGRCQRGVLMCSTGIGMSIAANKINGIRAALCHNELGARRARQHSAANVLCLGQEEGMRLVAEIVDVFLATEFEGGRHQLRVNRIAGMER